MALLAQQIWPPTGELHKEHGSHWRTAMHSCNLLHPNLSKLFIWEKHPTCLANKRLCQQNIYSHHNSSQSVYFCQSTWVTYTWAHWTDQRKPYNSMLLYDDSFCRSFQLSHLRLRPEVDHRTRNPWCKACLQTLCQVTWCYCHSLPCQQWMLCWKVVHQWRQQARTNKMLTFKMVWRKYASKTFLTVHVQCLSTQVNCGQVWSLHIFGPTMPYAWLAMSETQHPTQKKISLHGFFLGTKLKAKLSDFHPFGCPAYVLDSNLQARKKILKWKECACVGIYIGHSQSHAWLISLILSMTTGLVSPQFHVTHNNNFETIWKGKTPSSRWH